MSKSKGNVVAPQTVSDTLGAEILRLWVGATDYSGELSISNEILKRVVEGYRRIRNTLRFLLANTSDFDPARDAVPADELFELDRYALDVAAGHFGRYAAEIRRCTNFTWSPGAAAVLFRKSWAVVYLDILKDRLYTTAADSIGRRSAQTVLAIIRDELIKLMAPILSFTAEEAWRIVHPEDPTIFAATWGAEHRVVRSDSPEFCKRWTAISGGPRTWC